MSEITLANIDTATGEIVNDEYMQPTDYQLIYCSMDTSDPNTMIDIVNGFASAESLNKSVGKDTVLNVTGVYITPGYRKSRDPRVPDAPCLNTYIVTDDTTYFTQSSGIARSVQLMSSIPGFFDAPKKMQVVSNKTSSDNTIKVLKVVK